MSKTVSSLPLVAILRFDIPSSSTRTVNATQAFDTISSGLVLGSFTGTLFDKSVAVKKCGNCGSGSRSEPLSKQVTATSGVIGSVSFTALPDGYRGQGVDMRGHRKTGSLIETDVSTITLNASYQKRKVSAKSLSANNVLRQEPDPVCGVRGPECTLAYTGTSLKAGSSRSKATNSNTIYYGAITVGLGEYKKWLGKYAVLKINTVTEKAILRIYDA